MPWEVVAEQTSSKGLVVVDRTERLPVPGGFLYRTIHNLAGIQYPEAVMAMVFVPGDDLTKAVRSIGTEIHCPNCCGN